ncbi:branched-chain amino acid transporter permease [Methanosphaera sp. WGK6]|uniref:branched-chain amino acid transporter permease n=1 Tax=Methanosphaera sp. WGK6 TaxID=1561964 RepID=UPI00084BCCC7|nr:AzlD domain-containing protein [Methanosphaera sp. WGK6]OED29761.1 branched-chain amino acid transporter AzlD [Methanosphaera sp. WGK6]
MQLYQEIIIILVASLATLITRFLPFIFFRSDDKTPAYIKYMGNVLPSSVFGLIVIYALRNTTILTGSHGIPEAIGIIITIILYYWKHDMIIPIVGGTISYMILIQFIFV